jgi:hypothetical protein
MECRRAVAVPTQPSTFTVYIVAELAPHQRTLWMHRSQRQSAGDLADVGGFRAQGRALSGISVRISSAKTLGRPVKWIEDRRKFVAASGAR